MHFLSAKLPAWAGNERHAFDALAGGHDGCIVLYGFGDLGRRLLRGMRSVGIEPVGIVDARLTAADGQIEGVPCASPEEGAARWGGDAVFVVAVFNQTGERAFTAIRQRLQAAGAARVVYFLPFLWKHAEGLLPYYSLALPSEALACRDRIQKAFDLFADERSREDFSFYVESILSPEPGRTLAASSPEQTYFPADLIRLSNREVFVDCGAYDGDTLLQIDQLTGGEYAGYIGVEPDPANYARLASCIGGLRPARAGALEAHAVGVGDRQHRLGFHSQGTMSSAIGEGGDLSIPVETLATIIQDRVPTYVKMDIEGFEMGALQGGDSVLRRTRPKLAVCVYHTPDHSWSLPLHIDSLDAGYRLYFRRHSEYLADVVCYALPD